jgi:hypothetical protein
MPRQPTELANRHLHGVTLSVRLFVELLLTKYYPVTQPSCTVQRLFYKQYKLYVKIGLLCIHVLMYYDVHTLATVAN